MFKVGCVEGIAGGNVDSLIELAKTSTHREGEAPADPCLTDFVDRYSTPRVVQDRTCTVGGVQYDS